MLKLDGGIVLFFTRLEVEDSNLYVWGNENIISLIPFKYRKIIFEHRYKIENNIEYQIFILIDEKERIKND